MIYLDNAATTQKKPQSVIEAVVEAMTTFGNAGRGAYDESLKSSRTIYQARRKIADFFGCENPDHVIFTSNATESLNIALFGTVPTGSHVITTNLEHNSVLRPLYALERDRDVQLGFVGEAGKTCIFGTEAFYEEIEQRIMPNTRVLVCTHASNVTGEVIDLKRMSEIAHKHALIFIVDASQSAGILPIHMKEMGIDILCFTGHKGLMGPQGTGGMCIADGIEINPFKRGGTGVHSYDIMQPMEYPIRLEAGTLNGHGIAGLSAAIDYLNEVGIQKIREKEQALVKRFYDGVAAIPKVTVYGSYGKERSVDRIAVLSLNIGSLNSAAVAEILSEEYGIAVRSGAHCAPLMHECLGTIEQGTVRFSFSYFNTEEEIDRAIQAVEEIAAQTE